MSLERYDLALEKKLKCVFPNVKFYNLEEGLSESSSNQVESEDANGVNREKQASDQIVSVPVILFDRINNPFAFERQGNDPLIRRGRHLQRGGEDVREHAFPVDLQYQIDIVSDKRVEVDGIWRELTYYLYVNSNIAVVLRFNDEDQEYLFNIKLIETDNTTDVASFSDKGRLYRQTITIEIPDAKMIIDERVKLVEEFPVRVLEWGEE